MKKLLLVSFSLILVVCVIQKTGDPKTPSGTFGTSSANPKIAAAYQGTKQVSVYATLKDYEEAEGIRQSVDFYLGEGPDSLLVDVVSADM